MKIKYIVILFVSTTLNACSQQVNQFKNTKWEYKLTDDCVNFIEFKDNGTYVDYNCELDYPFSGNYEIVGDTILMTEIDLVSDLPNTKETEVKAIFKMILSKQGLTTVHIKRKIENEWEGKKIYNPQIFYTKK